MGFCFIGADWHSNWWGVLKSFWLFDSRLGVCVSYGYNHQITRWFGHNNKIMQYVSPELDGFELNVELKINI